MSENTGHESHPSSSSHNPFVIPSPKVPHLPINGVNGAHQFSRISSAAPPYDYQDHQVQSNMIPEGGNVSVIAGGTHSQYNEASSASHRVIYHPGGSTATAAQWPASPYPGQAPNSATESDQSRTSPVAHSQHQSWDRPRTPIPRQQTPIQDPNFAHPHNMPGHSAYNMHHPYRPPHHPVEPQAAAPSPPNQYPPSPRNSAPPTNPNNLPVSTAMRQPPARGSFAPTPGANGMSHHQDQRRDSFIDQSHRQDYPMDQITFPISGDDSPRSSQNLQNYTRQPAKSMLPENGNCPTQPLGPPVYNHQKRYPSTASPISPASNSTYFNSGYQPQQVRSTNSDYRFNGNNEVSRGPLIEDGQYRAVPDPELVATKRPGTRRPTPVADYRLTGGQHSTIVQTLPGNSCQRDDDETDEEEGNKREISSRTASASPIISKRNLPNNVTVKRSRSISSVDSQRDPQTPDGFGNFNGVTTQRKRKPVFEESGKQYYENDVVPPGVQIPSGYMLGIGKIKGQLLPEFVEGIKVNPEWGLTAGGKARQRLPRACESCRAKKIKCVECPESDVTCQHCYKMSFTCSGFSKDEDAKPSKKSREKASAPSSVVGAASSASQESQSGSNGGSNGPRNRGAIKKRKASDDSEKNSGFPKRGKSSRASSFSTEPLDAAMSGIEGGGSETPMQHQSQTTPVQKGGKFALFATQDALPQNATHIPEERIPPERSRKYYARQLQEQFNGPSSVGYGMYPKSLSETPPHSYTSASPTSSHSLMEHHSYSSMNNGYAGGSKFSSTPPTIGTPTMAPISQPMGEDHRHHALPSQAVQEHLAEVYFANIYSQTYAFLHRDTFMRDLAKHPPVLMFSLMAVSARFSREHRRSEEIFAKYARELILENFSDNKLEMVQSMIHMGLHDFGCNQGQKAWMFAGMAVRMGAALNLNLEPKKKGKSAASLIAQEVARRTYWAYYLMDRMNSYGVARPFLVQDHDCHIQLPCNQPSFQDGKPVTTEHLLGPNPCHPNHGNEHMGAMAYLVRIVGIWGNILKQIHLSGFQYAERSSTRTNRTEFDNFIDQLENWRKTLPTGLQYSNENLAGQIKVGTTGAFVMMHVMWHTAMEYVHRYIRTTRSFTADKTSRNKIVESIRKAFVHADAVLEIMSHVKERIKEAKSKNMETVTVNAPFIGQAISDACNITIRRALELHGEPAGAEEQKARVFTGLSWLKELKKYWKPIEGMYLKLKKTCKQLEARMSQPPPPNRRPQMLSSDSGNIDLCSIHAMSQVQDPNNYDPQPILGSDQMNPALHDSVPVNQLPFSTFQDVISYVPEDLYEDVFGGGPGQLAELSEIAAGEGGFPNLYVYPGSTFATIDEMPTVIAGSQNEFRSHASLEPSPMPSMEHFELFEMEHDHMHGSREDEGSDLDENGQPLTPEKLKELEKVDISTCYFHPTAVREGKFNDGSASESSGSESRRESKASPKAEINMNRMDLLNLLSHEDYATKVTEAVGDKNSNDQMTGKNGSTAPKDGEVKGVVYYDNARRPSRT